MNLDKTQLSDLHRLLAEGAFEVTGLIAQGILATATHNRPSTINLVIKIGRNADDPLLIEVCSQRKIKAPKSKHSDLTSWDEVEPLAGYRTDEEPGQERLPDMDGEHAAEILAMDKLSFMVTAEAVEKFNRLKAEAKAPGTTAGEIRVTSESIEKIKDLRRTLLGKRDSEAGS